MAEQPSSLEVVDNAKVRDAVGHILNNALLKTSELRRLELSGAAGVTFIPDLVSSAMRAIERMKQFQLSGPEKKSVVILLVQHGIRRNGTFGAFEPLLVDLSASLIETFLEVDNNRIRIKKSLYSCCIKK